MSTKCTISHSNKPEEDYHLYSEVFDQENIYIQVSCASEISVEHIKNNPSTVKVGIPIKVWRDMVSGWIESHWAKNPDMDNAEIEFSTEGLEALLNQINKNKNKVTIDDEE